MCVYVCVCLCVCLCLLVFSCSHLRFAPPDWRAFQRLWCVSCTQSPCLYTESRCLLLLQWRVFLRIALSPSPVLARKKGSKKKGIRAGHVNVYKYTYTYIYKNMMSLPRRKHRVCRCHSRRCLEDMYTYTYIYDVSESVTGRRPAPLCVCLLMPYLL